MMKSIKRLLLMGAVITVMMSIAAPAIADEVQDQRADPPVKDPGISTCDITPSKCKSTPDPVADPEHNPVTDPVVDSGHNPPKDQGINSCDLTPAGCKSSPDPATDPSGTGPVVRDHRDGSSGGVDGKSGGVVVDPVKDPGISSCDITPSGCPGSVADPKMGITSTIPTDKEKGSAQEKGSAPNATTASDIHGCPYGFGYSERFDTCLPDSPDDFGGVLPVFFGNKPWPGNAGGYVGLLGGTVQDATTAVGLGLQIGLGHYVGDTLVDFGEGGGPIGWGIQGLGYTLGFTGDAAGVLVEGAGQVVGAVADGVGEVIDGVGSAIGDAADEISSWF